MIETTSDIDKSSSREMSFSVPFLMKISVLLAFEQSRANAVASEDLKPGNFLIQRQNTFVKTSLFSGFATAMKLNASDSQELQACF